MPVGGLHQNIGRGIADLADAAAHHAGQRGDALCIGDHDVVRIEVPGHLVECRHSRSLNCPVHSQLPTPDQVMIKSVKRLTHLQHDVVGDVDHVADRPDSCPLQALAHPQR